MVSTSKGWFPPRLARQSRSFRTLLVVLALVCPALVHPLQAQDDPLNTIHVTPPPPKPTAPTGPPPAEGKAALRARPGERIRVDVNLVLIPLTVTDPLNRLVTGLERKEFFLYENNNQQQ
ncbi:MAG TPA: hypothetical protein VE109_04490, partial [Acidobacteriaceae bacterium]|nr:hypothetical protein [Acidobacteriaceae bacterium]